ncbi:GntR family transcriptional regulator [Telmatospirillum sp.]|uniref:GntR family transcriptional regulator n=1 Tax=Telmatospirillum sp. TaxID=2079197 RepID=UPI00283C0606|nr:GntR family transcriptional regulator [Telmatospirillum sp.]MDR3435299.1 GntR family transcriptional regulator [Telmatospirillum sp.]
MIDLLQTPEALGAPSYQRVRDAIRTDIARGALAPNSRLKAVELANRYGLSPAPIREALGHLAAEGWVVIHPHRGAQVRAINSTFLQELNEIRLGLESYLVGQAAVIATPTQIDALEAIESLYEATLAGAAPGGIQALIRINLDLHRTIMTIRPNAEAAALMSRHRSFFNSMRVAWGYSDYRPERIVKEHRQLLAAFRDNDGDRAEKVSREHVRNAMDDLLRLWREAGRD